MGVSSRGKSRNGEGGCFKNTSEQSAKMFRNRDRKSVPTVLGATRWLLGPHHPPGAIGQGEMGAGVRECQSRLLKRIELRASHLRGMARTEGRAKGPGSRAGKDGAGERREAKAKAGEGHLCPAQQQRWGWEEGRSRGMWAAARLLCEGVEREERASPAGALRWQRPGPMVR